ncbi:Tim17/Tim22/Tim23/Pmp24 family-domain-containing protein [Schizophyllum amplum]|uniref:Tim17/Tim22/Tim23/Pmp24 family-domain-containing protein n=1 Tax=Schizophyllum amplum TaxID=97359 RepID=A0A550C5L3_9AGAR|nr:Tim17/Tim22/Tim23/Pmp24 family-domain-containing protein [Auriculariopsis ampla]
MSSSLSAFIQEVVTNPAYSDYLAILKGARNGFVTGVKIRLPHALVMSVLFGRGDWQTRARGILRATRQHATTLAKFVTIYKSLLLLLRKARGGKQSNPDSLIAGLIGAYAVFRERTSVNEQIVLYVVARVVASFLPRAGPPSATPGIVKPQPADPLYYTVFATIMMGSSMWLFENRGETIQRGLFNSMVYMYHDSDKWKDLKTLLWHNT